jgi:hypothetical protein
MTKTKDELRSSIMEDVITVDEDRPSDFSKVVDILLNDSYKRRKTILNNRQVAKITTIDVISQIYDIPFLKSWVNNFGEWRTSGDNGKGRQDIVEISKFQYSEIKKDREELITALRGK